jgi:hypothetical protein
MLNSYCHRDPITGEIIQDTYTDAQVQEVAKLSRYCGQAAHMNYSPEASGASVANMRNAMIAFGFDSVQYEERTYPSGWWPFFDPIDYTQQWEDMLRAELDAGRPILYVARDEYGGAGHAFICDGYNSEGLFHFNLGWYGYSDGWYVSTAINVIYPNGTEYYFNSGHKVIYGLRPPEGWQPPVPIIKGDVNSDGQVTIKDVTILIDHLLAGGIINFYAADVNNKDGITIADVTALIDLLLTTP